MITKDLDWFLLQRFTVCARHKNFKNAAKEIGIAPSVLSRDMKRLEESMQCKLFVRGSGIREVDLTNEGLRLFFVTSSFEKEIQPLIALNRKESEF